MLQLTRYLYSREEVEYSLLISLLKRKESAFFWAYELYYSGLEQELIQFIWKLYYNYYAILNRGLENYIYIKSKNINEETIYQIINNLLVRKWCFDVHILLNKSLPNKSNFKNLLLNNKYKQSASHLLLEYKDEYLELICNHFDKNFESEKKKFKKSIQMNDISINIKLLVFYLNNYALKYKIPIGKNIFVQSDDFDKNKYKTIVADFTPRGGPNYPLLPKRAARTILSEATLEKIESDINLFDLSRESFNIKEELISNWEYHAYNTPLWKQRLNNYKINQNVEEKKIEFLDDDEMESFYNEYGYEPDEQSVEIQNKLLGVLTKKMNVNFYKKNIILIK